MNQPVKIIVLGDTHVNRIKELPRPVIEAIRSADLIIHLGDFGSPEVYRYLAETGRLKAVFGNHDGTEVRQSLKEREIIEVRGKKLALLHGNGCYSPFGIRSRLLKHFKGEKVDAVLFGHMHVPDNKKIGGVLFFNPGSTANKFPSLRPSYGLLTIDDTIRSKICYVSYAPHPVDWNWVRRYVTNHLVQLLPPRRKFVLRRALISMAFAFNFSLMTALVLA